MNAQVMTSPSPAELVKELNSGIVSSGLMRKAASMIEGLVKERDEVREFLKTSSSLSALAQLETFTRGYEAGLEAGANEDR